MEKKRFKITAEDIISGKQSAADALAPVYELFDLSAGYLNYVADCTLVNTEQLLCYAVHYYIEEVAAGGHEKFLLDPAGMLWREVIIGLDEIGAPDTAEMLREMRSRFHPELAFEQAQRVKQVQEGDMYFDEEDKFFHEHEKELRFKLTDYIRDYAEKFEFDGEI